MESAVLSFNIAFTNLKLTLANIDLRAENAHAIAFYKRLGMKKMYRADHDIFFSYTCDQYCVDRKYYENVLREL